MGQNQTRRGSNKKFFLCAVSLVSILSFLENPRKFPFPSSSRHHKFHYIKNIVYYALFTVLFTMHLSFTNTHLYCIRKNEKIYESCVIYDSRDTVHMYVCLYPILNFLFVSDIILILPLSLLF